jgi:hypothetical protein
MPYNYFRLFHFPSDVWISQGQGEVRVRRQKVESYWSNGQF